MGQTGTVLAVGFHSDQGIITRSDVKIFLSRYINPFEGSPFFHRPLSAFLSTDHHHTTSLSNIFIAMSSNATNTSGGVNNPSSSTTNPAASPTASASNQSSSSGYTSPSQFPLPPVRTGSVQPNKSTAWVKDHKKSNSST